MQRMLKFILMIAIGGLLASCASMFGDNNHQITVNSTPQGARVYVNSVYQGTTPTTFILKKLYNEHVLQVRKPGYVTRTIPIDTEFQKIGFLNFIGTGLIGFGIDFINDDMFKISSESRSINVNLKDPNY